MSEAMRQRVLTSDEEIDTPETGKPQKTRQPLTTTIGWDEIPDWQRDNEYIIAGYRRLQHSWKGCVHSVFSYLHNETVNIHSHMWGGIFFVYLLLVVYPDHVSSHYGATWKDTTVMRIFLLSAISCLFGSATYHTSGCHSEPVSTRCRALDYSGIVVLIVGSFFPSIYYGFYCDPGLQLFYLVAISVMGLGASSIVLNPEYAKPTHRSARTTVFIALGLSAVMPIGHLLVSHEIGELMLDIGFGWLVASGALYIGGAVIYAKRLPEKWSPGTFDIWGSSHQIFHVCVVLAALAHYKSVLTGLDYRMQHPVCGV